MTPTFPWRTFLVMVVLVLNRFFPPDESATALLAGDLVEDLVAAGHEVHVLCSRRSLTNPYLRPAAEEEVGGAFVHRLPSFSFGRGGFSRRAVELASFHLSLRLRGRRACRPDVLFVMTDPPLLVAAAIALATKVGGQVVHYVADVYPDVAVAEGALSPDGFLARKLEGISRRALRRCARVIPLCAGMAEVLKKKGVATEKTRVVPPWADGRRLRPVPPRENALRRELGYTPDDFVVMYSGNMGRCHSFETVSAGAEALREEERVAFLFVGGGAQREMLENEVRRRGLPRFRFLPYRSRDKLAETLSAGDLHLVTQKPETEGLIFPSKTAGVLAVGRPVLFIGKPDGDAAEAVRRGGCGRVAAEGDSAAFVAAVKELRQQPAEREELSRRARELFEAEYDRAVLVPRLIAEIEAAGNREGSSG